MTLHADDSIAISGHLEFFLNLIKIRPIVGICCPAPLHQPISETKAGSNYVKCTVVIFRHFLATLVFFVTLFGSQYYTESAFLNV